MATTVTRYVNTNSTAGGDGTTSATVGANRAYVSLNAALTAEYAATPDLVSSDIFLDIICGGTSADTVQVLWSSYNFTTDATRYIRITGERTRVRDTNKYRLEVSSNPAMSLPPSYTHIRQMQIRSATGYTAISVGGRAAGYRLTVEHCLFDYRGLTNRGNGHAAVYRSGTNQVFINLIGNIVLGALARAFFCQYGGASGNVRVYNNTMRVEGASATDALLLTTSSGACRVYNNILEVTGGAGSCYSLGGATTANNISSDATSPQAGLQNITLTFADSANGDLALVAGDASAIDVGTDMSADGSYAFSTDIEGNSFVTWDIGAVSFNTVGGPSLVWSLNQDVWVF